GERRAGLRGAAAAAPARVRARQRLTCPRPAPTFSGPCHPRACRAPHAVVVWPRLRSRHRRHLCPQSLPRRALLVPPGAHGAQAARCHRHLRLRQGAGSECGTEGVIRGWRGADAHECGCGQACQPRHVAARPVGSASADPCGAAAALLAVNRWLVGRIGEASKQMMASKDARVQAMQELLDHVAAVRAMAMEGALLSRINVARHLELSALAVRKYLDAWCVYFWACTPVLFSLATFSSLLLLGRSLNAPVVFTSLALFNVLLGPLNSFPWVINGIVEVGIAGRTGAGKSSLLAALFRLRPLTLASATTATTTSSTSSSSRASGIFIDGVNTAHVSLSCLRTALAIIPQTPLIFHAPIRDNLDPEGRHADVALWDAVRKCHLDAAVGRLGGLDAMVGGAAGGLSLGERQLLCLARVMLRKSKCTFSVLQDSTTVSLQVLCLDECTANIDAATSALMHATIAREFHGVTTITIAHRVSSLLSLPRVLIFESGALVRKHSGILTMFCLSSFKCCSCCGVD
ncbi:unnamed protein product, partial [Closterium sp. Naga37s-1]